MDDIQKTLTPFIPSEKRLFIGGIADGKYIHCNRERWTVVDYNHNITPDMTLEEEEQINQGKGVRNNYRLEAISGELESMSWEIMILEDLSINMAISLLFDRYTK